MIERADFYKKKIGSQAFKYTKDGRRSRDNSDGIATRLGLNGTGIETRSEARFSAPVLSGSEAHPACYTMDTGSFPGLRRPERGFDQPTPSSAEVKERVELYLYSHFGPSWSVLG